MKKILIKKTKKKFRLRAKSIKCYLLKLMLCCVVFPIYSTYIFAKNDDLITLNSQTLNYSQIISQIENQSKHPMKYIFF